MNAATRRHRRVLWLASNYLWRHQNCKIANFTDLKKGYLIS